MARFRIYPSKENTIASSTSFESLNSSQNTVFDLWYGGQSSQNSISRHLFKFDLTELSRRIASNEINSDLITAYKLKAKNAIPSDKVLDKEFEFNRIDKKIAASFDLIAFPINKDWDEGRGFDLVNEHFVIKQTGNLLLTGVSNWNSATTISAWDEPGVYTNPTASTAVTFYSTQHFAIGNEDIDMDITDIVNDWLSGGTENNGIAVSYSRTFEIMEEDHRLISSFFTNKTNTSYKPYLEVEYDQVIKDDRHQVSNNRSSRLFLYLFSGNTPTSYFSAGTVSVKTFAGADVFTGLTPTELTKGVYYVDVLMTGTTKGQKFKDVWQGVTFQSGIDQQDFTQIFQIRGNFYTNNATETNNYSITTYGLDNNETLQAGEVIRVYADTRINFSLERPVTEYGLEYKLTLNDTVEVIPWTSMNDVIIDGCFKSYLDLDTSWLLNSQRYTITFRVNELGTKKILPEKIDFRVVENFNDVNA